MAVSWDELKEGQALPEQKKTPTLQTLVKYSAGSGDFNPLHHDYGFTQAKQIGSIIIHGRFKYAALGQLVSDWLGHNGRIAKLSCQYRGMDMPDQEIALGGTVSRVYEEDGAKKADLSIWTKNAEGKTTTPGEATVIFRG